MAVNGRNIYVTLAGDVIAGTRSNEMETGAEIIEVSSPSQGSWRSYIKGRKEWQVTTGFLLLSESNLFGMLNIGTTYTLKFQNRSGVISLTGQAILTTCRFTSTIGNLVQGSFVFKGVGALS